MDRSWTRTRRVTILAAPVLVSLALSTAASASVTGRAPFPASPRAGVTWHPLVLKNGWRSAQRGNDTGNPAWAVKGGVVYLSGSLRQSGGTRDQFAVLPPAARPSHALHITVYTLGGAQGYLYIQPRGAMYAGGQDVKSFTSLAGVSFPARSLAQRGLALRNGWNSSQFRWNTGDPSYAVRGGVVYLSGALHQRVSGSHVFAVLPAPARPPQILYITVYTFDGTTGILVIRPNGAMEAYSGLARSLTSLAGVSFPASMLTPTTLTLLNGWESSDGIYGTGDPAYVVHNGVVYLSGALNLPSGSSDVFAQLPPSAWPAHFLYMKIYTINGVVGSMDVQPSGMVEIFRVSESEAFSSLAGLSYPLGS